MNQTMISNVEIGEQHEESAGFNRLRFFDENNPIEIKDEKIGFKTID